MWPVVRDLRAWQLFLPEDLRGREEEAPPWGRGEEEGWAIYLLEE